MRNLGLFPCGTDINSEYFFEAKFMFLINYFPAWVGKKRHKVKKKIDC